jgi:hypothetical protein
MSKPFAFGRAGRNAGRGSRAGTAERLLEHLASDAGFADALLGDLAEERATRAERDGPVLAGRWYLREALRSAPYLAANSLRLAWRRDRTLFGALAAGGILLVTVVASAMLRGDPLPARLLVPGDAGDGIVVNNVKPVRLGVRVLDADGVVLPDTGLRYRWLGGAPIAMSARGVATCTGQGDAIVRVATGFIATNLVLRCRPVTRIDGSRMLMLVEGGPAVGIPFRAVDSRGRIVSQLRGEISVDDTSVASLVVARDGSRVLHPRSEGRTMLHIRIGDRDADLMAEVFRPDTTLSRMRAGELRAVSVHLRGTDVRQWNLVPSRALYLMHMESAGDDEHRPGLAVTGASCVQIDAHAFMCAAPQGGTVYAYAPRYSGPSQERDGVLAVERRENP